MILEEPPYPTVAVYAVARWGPSEVVLFDQAESLLEVAVPLAFADAWHPVLVVAERTIAGVGIGLST